MHAIDELSRFVAGHPAGGLPAQARESASLLVADLIGSSRRLLEDALLRVRKLELEIGNPEVDYHDGGLNAPAPASEPGARRLGGRGA